MTSFNLKKMTEQELLILSFFDKTIPRQLNEKLLTTEMIGAGIGSNDAANFQHYKLVHQLKNQDLLILYEDPLKTTTGLSRPIGPELLVLSDKALQLLQREEIKINREAYVTELQFNKLKQENDLLEKRLADYTKTKRQAFWATVIAFISTIVAILSLIIC